MNMPAMPPPSPPGAPPAAASNRGTMALVLGIIGVVCCQLAGPFAWYLGSNELKAIRAGLAPASGEGVAKAGMILGIIASVLFVFVLIWIFLAGGLAFLSAMAGNH